jgi:hypothetical protein
MRKRYRVLILAAFVAALAVPLGFALSLESSSVIAPRVSEAVVVAASAKSSSSYTVEPTRRRSFIPPLSDGARLLFVGSALFGLAAAIRKANG